MIKSKRMKWARHVARVGEKRNAYTVSVGKLERKNHLEDLGLDGRIILNWMLTNEFGPVYTGYIGTGGNTIVCIVQASGCTGTAKEYLDGRSCVI
jgi:hypothetical protein